jgi:hypothetical protein
MSFAQIKRATRDATSHGPYDDSWKWKRLTGPRYILIPSLGAIGNQDDKRNVELIAFYTQPYDSSSTVPGLVVTNPFRGNVGGRLYFQNGPVGRNEIEAAFGKIQQGVTNSGASISRVSVSSIKKGEPFIIRQDNSEDLYYPNRGLSFQLRGGVVVSFNVSKPANPD